MDLEHEHHTLGPAHSPLHLTMAHKRRTAALLCSQADTTGLMPWRAGCLLAHLLACRRTLMAGARVVELGCGSGLLSCVAVASGAAAVLATDASAEALALAVHNLAHNAAAAEGGAGGCGARTAKLRWGAPSEASRALGLFDLALASEVFYHHKGGGLIDGIGAQADALFSTAVQQLLTPCTCGATPPAGQPPLHSAGSAAPPPQPEPPLPPCGAGLLLLAYSPRYPCMARALRASASAMHISLRTLSRSHLLTPDMRANMTHTDTRLLAACACSAALLRHVVHLGSPPAAPMSEDSEWEEGAWDAGWETADAQGPGSVGLEALFT
jgi:hypothetical protein